MSSTRVSLLATLALATLALPGCAEEHCTGASCAGAVIEDDDDASADDDASGDDDTGDDDVTTTDAPVLCTGDEGCASDRVCDPGTGACNPGVACTADAHCGFCDQGSDCGFGGQWPSRCDPDRGVCTRVKGLCAPCAEDAECQDPGSVPGESVCAQFEDGGRYCTFARSCPLGFRRDSTDASDPCRPDDGVCAGRAACSQDVDCNPAATALRCARRGAIPGACVRYCQDDLDCAPTAEGRRVCDPARGVCLPACGTAGCTLGNACEPNGHCEPACDADTDCAPGLVCNQLGGTVWKPEHDEGACIPEGCLTDADCLPETVCDLNSGECIPGCHTDDNCYYGTICQDETCFDPGCLDKILDCDLNEFCCGDVPYRDSCPAGVEVGECFVASSPPWCAPCTDSDTCGEGGLCLTYADDRSFCGVPCGHVSECPRGWQCQNIEQGCQTDADCGGGPCNRNAPDDETGICGCTGDAQCTEPATCESARCRVARDCIFQGCP